MKIECITENYIKSLCIPNEFLSKTYAYLKTFHKEITNKIYKYFHIYINFNPKYSNFELIKFYIFVLVSHLILELYYSYIF